MEPAIAVAIGNRNLTKASQVLMGIVTGITADAHLHDLELKLLSTWLTANEEVATTWPGSAIAHHLRDIMADGVVTEEERTHFLSELQRIIGADFAETGSVTPEVAGLPFDTSCELEVRDSTLCFTGTFVYGTRAACEKITTAAGGICTSTVSRKVAYLVVGTHISPDWVSTSYGRKIQSAMDLQRQGHPIAILSEQRWLDAMQAL